MRKNKFVDHVIRNRFRKPKELEDVFVQARKQRSSRRRIRQRQKRPSSYYLTGVHNGTFYRVKVPPKRDNSVLPDMPKLQSPQFQAPKPFQHTGVAKAAKDAVVAVAATTSSSTGGGSGGSAAAAGGGSHQVEAGSRPPAAAVVANTASTTTAKEEASAFFRKLKEWWNANWAILVLNCGSVCTLVGFTRSDVLELRSLAVLGSLSSCTYLSVQRPFRLTPVLWTLTFATVNAWKIYQILDERTSTVRLTKEQEEIYVTHFLSHGVTPKQFEAIYDAAEVIRYKKGSVIVRQGEPVRHVYLIGKGHTFATSLGRRVSAAAVSPNKKEADDDDDNERKAETSSGAWAGEMEFLKQYWVKEQGQISKIQNIQGKLKKDNGDEGRAQQPLTTKADSAAGTEGNSSSKQQPDESSNEHDLDEEDHRESIKRRRPAANIHHKRTFKIEDHQIPEKNKSKRTSAYMCTIIATDDCTVLRWPFETMDELMARSIDMRSALTRAMTAAIVGKVIHFTVSRAQSRHGAWPTPWLLGHWANSAGARIEVSGEEGDDSVDSDVGEKGGGPKERIPTTTIKKFSS